MTTSAIITVAGNACSILITLLLLLGVAGGVSLKENLNRIFLGLLIINLLGSICEGAVMTMMQLFADTMTPVIVALELLNWGATALLIIAVEMYLYVFLLNP